MASEQSTGSGHLDASVEQATPPNLTPVAAGCHCGRVTIELPSTPQRITECHCTICYAYGALWAYYTRGDVTVTVAAEPSTSGGGVSQIRYIREDEGTDGDLAFYHCGHCGCLTHWWGVGDTPKRNGDGAKMGINCRMLGEKTIEGVERDVRGV